MKQFDLFKLHNSRLDIKNQSWICFQGRSLTQLINEMSKNIMKQYKFNSKNKLCKFLAKKLGCKAWTIEQVIYNHKQWYPIIIINKLISLLPNKNYKSKILKEVEYIKCNSSKSKPIKAVKYLNLNLCKIAGAHTADGNIILYIGLEIKDKHLFKKILRITKKYDKNKCIFITNNRYRLQIKTNKPESLISKIKKEFPPEKVSIWLKYCLNLTEGYYKSSLAYKRWIDEVFETNVSLKKHGTKNAWRIDFYNKIIARYLINFFDFPSGPKTFTVKEPKIIRTSNLKNRRGFLLGLMTFEGYSFGYRKHIGILIKNRYIAKSAKEILESYKIPLRKLKKDGYGRWSCSSKILKRGQFSTVLNIFEPKTEKWDKINNLLKC